MKKEGWILSLTVLGIMTGVCGCMLKDGSGSGIKNTEQAENGAEWAKDQALAYLNGRYDDTFTALGYTAQNWSYDYASIRFASEKYSGEPVEVYIRGQGETATFQDDYFRLLWRDDADAYFEELAAQCGADAVVKTEFRLETFPEGYTPESEFKDYVEGGSCNVSLHIITGEGMTREKREEILKAIASRKIQGVIVFMEADEPEKLREAAVSELTGKYLDRLKAVFHYYIDESFGIVSRD